jgi:hypothetical protein
MFKIKRYRKGLYLVEFDNQYDLAMTFVRYQEFYESESRKFQYQFFKLDDFIRYYSLKHGKGSFTYPKDFNGFNLPGRVISEVAETLLRSKYDYLTAHDFIMFKILNEIRKHNQTWDFYLIGVHAKGDKGTLKHELVHGLYFLKEEYRNKVEELIYNLPKQVRKLMYKKLKEVGYSQEVYNDELNAYMSTGLRNNMNYKCIKKCREQFKKLFKEYF